MLSRITTLAGLAFAGWLPACAGEASSSTPWPAIPSQNAYAEPDDDILVMPAAVVKGLTHDTSNPLGSSPMVFSSVNETYTRKSAQSKCSPMPNTRTDGRSILQLIMDATLLERHSFR